MNVLKPPLRLDVTTSTNDFAASLIQQGNAVNGMVITTLNQTAGKGLDQNRWESSPGENLTISIIIQPTGLHPGRQFQLNKITSLAVRDFVKRYFPEEPVNIKWPNDIYIADRKNAGILISNTIVGQEITWSVLGVGLNINQTKFESDAPNPVSFKQLSGIKYDLSQCLDSLCVIFDSRLKVFLNKEYHAIDSEYLEALYRFEENSQFIYKDQIIEAKITGVGEFGHLMLQTAGGKLIACDLKEVRFL